MYRYFKSVLILFLGFISVEAFSQNAASRLSDAVKFTVKNCKKDCISMQLLKSATQITYGFNNGSVAPKYAYQGYIVVTLQNIALKIYNQSSPCYSNYDITIKKELRTIFEGTEDEDVVTTKGRDVFESHIKCGHEKCV